MRRSSGVRTLASPSELIFNEGPNDLFVVRVAGNTLGEDVRGSLNYALEHLHDSLKLLVVLGHSGCGAVTAAVDVFLDPAGYLSLASKHAVRSVVDRLHIVVHASARRLEATLGPDVVRHPHYREALIEVAVVTNAALTAHTLQRQIIGSATAGVRVAYGVYVLADRMIWAPRCGSAGRDRPRGATGGRSGFRRIQRRRDPLATDRCVACDVTGEFPCTAKGDYDEQDQ